MSYDTLFKLYTYQGHSQVSIGGGGGQAGGNNKFVNKTLQQNINPENVIVNFLTF